MFYYNSVKVKRDQLIRLLELERKVEQPELLLPVVNGLIMEQQEE